MTADNKAIQTQVDTMLKQGTISKATHDSVTSDLTHMNNSAGASNGATEWNTAQADINQIFIDSSGKTPIQNGSMTGPDGKTVSAAAAGAVNNLLGDGTTPFASMMAKKYGISTGAGETSSKVAQQMADKGLSLYTDSTGNAIVYDSATRSGGGFDAQGGSVSTPPSLYPGNGNMTQGGSYSFSVGQMTATFGGQADSKGNKFGLDVSQ